MHEFRERAESKVSEAELRVLVERLTVNESDVQVADVAEALGVSVDVVETILADIRKTDVAAVESATTVKVEPKLRRMPAWYLGLIVASLLVAVLMFFMLLKPPQTPQPLPPTNSTPTAPTH